MKRLLLALTVIGFVFFLAAPTAVAQELTADDYVAFWQPQVGTWKGTIDFGEQPKPVTFRFRIAPNRKCILVSDEGEGPGLQQLQVYDPVAKQEKAWGVDKDGVLQIQTIVIDGMKKGMKAAKGVGGSWELKIFTSDGKTITRTSTWSFRELDDKQMVIVWTDAKEDGISKPDTKMVLERQPERERRAKQ